MPQTEVNPDDVFHSPETIEATERGIEDWRAGRVQPLSEVLAQMAKCPHPEDNQAWTSECCGAGYVDDLSDGAPDGSRLGFCARCRDGAAFVLVCDLCQENVNG